MVNRHFYKSANFWCSFCIIILNLRVILKIVQGNFITNDLIGNVINVISLIVLGIGVFYFLKNIFLSNE